MDMDHDQDDVDSFSSCRVPGFVTKVFQIFTDSPDDSLCVWGRGGRTIIIRHIAEFEATILPKYFKHSNYTSFVRQLNMYEFHKTVANPQIAEFHHPYFLCGRADLLHLVKRKSRARKAANADSESELPAPLPPASSNIELDHSAPPSVPPPRKNPPVSTSYSSSSSSSFSLPFRNSSNMGGGATGSFDGNVSNARWSVIHQNPEETTDYDLGLNSSSWVWRDDAQNSNAAHMSMSMSAPMSRNIGFLDRNQNETFESPKTAHLALPVSSTITSTTLALPNDSKDATERINDVEQKCSVLVSESASLKQQLERAIREQENTKAKLEGFMNQMRSLLENLSSKQEGSDKFIRVDLNSIANVVNSAIAGTDEAPRTSDVTVLSEAKFSTTDHGTNNITVTVDVESLASSVNEAIAEHQEIVNTIGEDSCSTGLLSDTSTPISLSTKQVAEVVAEAMNDSVQISSHRTSNTSNNSVSFVTCTKDVDGRSAVVMSLETPNLSSPKRVSHSYNAKRSLEGGQETDAVDEGQSKSMRV